MGAPVIPLDKHGNKKSRGRQARRREGWHQDANPTIALRLGSALPSGDESFSKVSSRCFYPLQLVKPQASSLKFSHSRPLPAGTARPDWPSGGGGGRKGGGKEEGGCWPFSSYSESCEAQQALCGTRRHSQATADWSRRGHWNPDFRQDSWRLNPDNPETWGGVWGEGRSRGGGQVSVLVGVPEPLSSLAAAGPHEPPQYGKDKPSSWLEAARMGFCYLHQSLNPQQRCQGRLWNLLSRLSSHPWKRKEGEGYGTSWGDWALAQCC